ncbi:FBXW7 [Acrasis kona]|uniref:FBXW7 n=1 Tax=Acrasis kona TaxID=1008807 RepID=A0AAW2Z913_9EUKA
MSSTDTLLLPFIDTYGLAPPLDKSLEITNSRPSTGANFLDLIPDEVCDYIMQFLGPKDLLVCGQVCTLMNYFSFQKHLWKTLCHNCWRGKVVNDITKMLYSEEQDWRELYFKSIIDGRRQEATQKDLEGTYWCYTSKVKGYYTGEMKFGKENYKSVQCFGYGRYAVDVGVWRLLEDGRTIIRRGTLSFPTLKIERRSDWGWSAEHAYTNFFCVTDTIN